MWSVVFLASPPTADIATHLPGKDFVSCFLPCTPNPTTGFFFYAPRDQVIELDITVEQAMTLIMSAGMAQPNGDAQKKLAALVENGRARATPSPPTAPVNGGCAPVQPANSAGEALQPACAFARLPAAPRSPA